MNEQVQPLKQASRRGIVWGVITIFCGIASIGSPLVSGLAVAIMVGIIPVSYTHLRAHET